MDCDTARTIMAKLPDDAAKGFPSAKSHAMGSAWRAKTFRRISICGLLAQVLREEE